MIGSVIVITGGSRGIGRALVTACVERGAHVVYAARTLRESDAESGAVGVAADVCVAADVARLVDTAIARFGRIDVLVNNAGTTGDAAAGDPAADFARVMATNVHGALACARAVLAVAPAARIVNVSSGVATAAVANAAAYIASKTALEGLTHALACDAPAATVTAIQLGGHRTELTARVYPAAEHAALPPPEAAVPALLHAMTAPAADVHDRVLSAWGHARAPLDRTALPGGSASPHPRAPLDLAGADALAHPLGPSPRARAALAAWAETGALARYPDPADAGLTKVLAALHQVPLDAIVLGGGASELIDRVLGVVLRGGERLVANTPSWPLVPHLCRGRGLVPVTVPYRLAGRRVDHDLDALAAAARADRRVRLVYLVSPSNPMGGALDDEPFARFLDALPDHVVVVVDEAYAEFITRPEALRAPTHVRRDARVVAIRTFSKFYALAGLRLGYAVASADLARRLAVAAPPFAITTGAQHAARAALADRDHAARTHALIAAGRAALAIDHLDSDAPFVLAAAPGVPRYFDGRYAMVSLWTTDPTTAIAPSIPAR